MAIRNRSHKKPPKVRRLKRAQVVGVWGKRVRIIADTIASGDLRRRGTKWYPANSNKYSIRSQDTNLLANSTVVTILCWMELCPLAVLLGAEALLGFAEALHKFHLLCSWLIAILAAVSVNQLASQDAGFGR